MWFFKLDFITQVGITYLSLLAVAAVMVAVQIGRAVIAVRRIGREMDAFMERGLCPCCGGAIPDDDATNCVYCKNWIAGYRREFRLKRMPLGNRMR